MSKKRLIIWTLIFSMLSLGFGLAIGVSQVKSFTPLILDGDGGPVPGSIAQLREVSLNGRKQWISIRGISTDLPILLFLAGGPGGTQMATVRHELGELEKHFLVVNWDQPGSGKSFSSVHRDEITPEMYVSDGLALAAMLRELSGNREIYLIGESWGSVLGMMMIHEAPSLFAGFIGTGQMVDFLETEKLDYDKAMALAKANGDDKFVKALEKQGPPPYYGNEISVAMKIGRYLQYLSRVMGENPEIQNPGYQTMRDMTAEEYGILDTVNFIRGIAQTFGTVYPRLYEIDLRKECPSVDVPVHFFLGRYDLNAPTSLVEDYAATLDAPLVKIVWFERSGHSPWINEREKFVEEVKVAFLGKV